MKDKQDEAEEDIAMKDEDVDEDQSSVDQREAEKVSDSKKKGRRRGEAQGMEEDMEENLVESKTHLDSLIFIVSVVIYACFSFFRIASRR